MTPRKEQCVRFSTHRLIDYHMMRKVHYQSLAKTPITQQTTHVAAHLSELLAVELAGELAFRQQSRSVDHRHPVGQLHLDEIQRRACSEGRRE